MSYLAMIVGAALGYGWHRLVGCPTGGCPLTSNPYISTALGAFIAWSISVGR